jgi:hypothetical protein
VRLNLFRSRRIPKFDDMSYDASMRTLPMFTRTGSASQKTLIGLARRARDAASTEQERRHAERWLAPLEAGRRIRTSVFPVKFYAEGHTPELIEDVESAFLSTHEGEET